MNPVTTKLYSLNRDEYSVDSLAWLATAFESNFERTPLPDIEETDDKDIISFIWKFTKTEICVDINLKEHLASVGIFGKEDDRPAINYIVDLDTVEGWSALIESVRSSMKEEKRVLMKNRSKNKNRTKYSRNRPSNSAVVSFNANRQIMLERLASKPAAKFNGSHPCNLLFFYNGYSVQFYSDAVTLRRSSSAKNRFKEIDFNKVDIKIVSSLEGGVYAVAYNQRESLNVFNEVLNLLEKNERT